MQRTEVDGMIEYKSFIENIPATGYWDQEILKELLPTNGFTSLFGTILVIPARSHFEKVDEINEYMKKFQWVLLILTGDEENVFPIEKIKHPKIKIYQQTPRKASKYVDRYLPNGYSPAVNLLKDFKIPRLRWSFAGQITHKRRKEMSGVLDNMLGGSLIQTSGFATGLDHEHYIALMQDSAVVPCPSGPVIPDTFRLYEALECGALPIVDRSDYWDLVFEDFPIPQIDSMEEVEGTINYFCDTFPKKQNECQEWWIRWKHNFKELVKKDLQELCGMVFNEDVTVLIPTSPISSHPDTAIIDETIKSVRDRLPDSKIILMFDGVREEQKDRLDSYNIYIKQMLFKGILDRNIMPLLFEEHTHQVEMTRRALNYVKSDVILFVEHDTPLCEDIPDEIIIRMIWNDVANVVRLNHEALVLKEHEPLYISKAIEINGELFRQTIQWSQRPHFANTEFYRNILNKYFSKNAKCMIEDGIHGHPVEDYKRKGKAGWNDWKIWTYTPPVDQKRSYTTDGRKGDPKFDGTFIY